MSVRDYIRTLTSSLPPCIDAAALEASVPYSMWEQDRTWAAAVALAACNELDGEAYLRSNPDVAAAGADPFLHYVEHGYKERRDFPIIGKSHKHSSSAEQIKVSVIIPVYNNAQYLDECITSVINQTLKEIEIIIVNDGSTDYEAVRIMEEYERKDKRIKLINKENTGYGHSVNTGLAAAKGEYVAIVESDDYIEPDMYEVLYPYCAVNNLDVIKTNIRTFTGCGSERSFICYDLASVRNCNSVFDPGDNVRAFDFTGFVAVYAGLYKREFLLSENIVVNETPGASFQDISFWFMTIVHAKRFMFNDKYLYNLRRDNEGSSVFNNKKLYPVCDEYMRVKVDINKRADLRDKFYKLYVKRMFLSYRWCYERAANELKQGFLQRFVSDFTELEDTGRLDLSLFSENDKKYYKNIMNSDVLIKRACIYISDLAAGGLERTACDMSIILKGQGFSITYILIYPERISYNFYGEVIFKKLADPKVKDILFRSEIIFDYKFKHIINDDDLIKFCIENYAYKYIATIHNTGKQVQYYFQLTNKYLSGNKKRLKAIIAVSEAVKQSFIETYGDSNNLAVINNYINIPAIDRNIQLCAIQQEYKFILFAGRLASFHKGLDILIPAFLAADCSSSVKLVLAGVGELDEGLKNLITSHPRGKMIELAGYVDLQKDGYLKNCMFLAAPSRFEGFSMVLLEALAANVPVLTTNVGGASDFVKTGVNGILLSELSVPTLSAAMDKLAISCKAMKKCCRRSVARYDLTRIGPQWLDVINGKRTPRKTAISIVMPVYNGEKYLAESLASALNQSVVDLEIICVDDGSTDATAQIIANMNDGRIRYFHQENGGAGRARNVALEHAGGEFVAFLDSDDKLPNAHVYEVLLENAARFDVNISGGNLQYIGLDGKLTANTNKEMIFLQNCKMAYRDWQYDFCYQNFIYRRSFLQRHNLKFPNYRRYQDPVFFVRAMTKAEYFCVSDQLSYVYRVREKNSLKWTREMVRDMLLAGMHNLSFAINNNLAELRTYTVNHIQSFIEYAYLMDNDITVSVLVNKVKNSIYNV